MTDLGMFHLYLPMRDNDASVPAMIIGKFTNSKAFGHATSIELETVSDCRYGEVWSLSSWSPESVLRAFEKNMIKINIRPPTPEEIASDTWKPEKDEIESIFIKKLKSIGWGILGFMGLLAFYAIIIILGKIIGLVFSSPQ
jgi:hypothetical protein